MYPTRDVLVNASDQPELTTLDEQTQDELRQLSIVAIEEFCGQKFVESTETRVLDGAGGKTLALDRRLATLTSLSVQGSSLANTDVGLNDKHSELFILPSATGGNWVEQVLREDMRPLFTAGVGTITLAGVWGWLDTELPDDDPTTNLALAMRLDMEDQAMLRSGPLADATRTMARARMASLDEGPLSLTLSQSIVPLSNDVQRLLADYVWQPVARVA